MKKIWKFKLKQETLFDIAEYIGPVDDFVFYDKLDGKLQKVGSIYNGWLQINKGYEWDGCTPKFRIFGKIFGIPDFQGTYHASLAHDFLIEYCEQHNICRKQIDHIFEKIMEEEGFFFRFLYATGVNLYRPIAVMRTSCC